MNTTTTTTILVDNYDYQGAAIYIAVILIWYSTGLIFMLFFHVRARTVHNEFRLDDYETTNQLTPATTNPFTAYYHIQADNTQKEILNELKDRQRRERLWKIYYSSTEQENEPHPRYYQTITADSATIGRINRKLATIHRLNEREDSTDISKRLNLIRRSSGSPLNREKSTVRTRSGSDSFTTTTTFVKEILTNQNSKKRNNKFFPRFTVERVSENQ